MNMVVPSSRASGKTKVDWELKVMLAPSPDAGMVLFSQTAPVRESDDVAWNSSGGLGAQPVRWLAMMK